MADQTIEVGGHAGPISFSIRPWGVVRVPAVAVSGEASDAQIVEPTGISSGEAFGTPRITLYVVPGGVASGEAFGTATVHFGIAATGIASSEAFGAHSLTVGVSPVGIGSGEAFGTPLLILYVVSTGIESDEAFGVPALQVYVSPTGIGTGEAFGTHRITLYVLPSGITPGDFGDPVVAPGVVYIAPGGIPSEAAVGTPAAAITIWLGCVTQTLGLVAPIQTILVLEVEQTIGVCEDLLGESLPA